jgi:hypothetical protein
MLFSIITPTIGSELLLELLESINFQSYTNIEHIIVIDGPEYYDKVKSLLDKIAPLVKRHIITLPYNTGNNGGRYNGHKIYASISHIVNGDFVCFLDEDNYYDYNHIEFYSNLINRYNLDWCYCLRKIVDNEKYICEDNCESLGYLHHCFYDSDEYFIDTNCTCIKKDILINICHLWNREANNTITDPDRLISKHLMLNYKNYKCSRYYTLNYRVADNKEFSVKKELFLKGNKVISYLYNGMIPWSLEGDEIFIIHFNIELTKCILNRIYNNNKDSICYNQWQLNILDNLNTRCCLSGYNRYIPSNSNILVHMFNIDDLPLVILERSDLMKILYTIEGPNIRHQLHWDMNILNKYFNKIITYWEPLLDKPNVYFFPFIHRYDFYNRLDTMYIQKNDNYSKNICIVLENRNIKESYIINDVELNALDYLRLEYSKELGKSIDCYGKSWEEYKDIINWRSTIDRFQNIEKTIDFMKKYTFVLIIENCDASGYVSEKIYDAISVGCIPLYYGNINTRIKIPKECYIDIKNIKPENLLGFIESMDESTVKVYKESIEKHKTDILLNVGVNAYNNIILNNL